MTTVDEARERCRIAEMQAEESLRQAEYSENESARLRREADRAREEADNARRKAEDDRAASRRYQHRLDDLRAEVRRLEQEARAGGPYY